MKTFEDYGVSLGVTPGTYNLADDVDLAVATYADLGLVIDKGRANDSFTKEVKALQAALPESVTSQPYDIVLIPRLGELSLDGLIKRYDELTSSKGNSRTAVWGRLWDKYSDEELSQGQVNPIEAHAVPLGGENDYDEPGLYFTNKNLKEQRKSLKEAQNNHDSDQTTLLSLPVAGYIVRNAMQLELGESLQDRHTFTRFIELDSKRVGGFSSVPYVYLGAGGQVLLFESHDNAVPYDGVRLSVGPKA